MQESEKRPQRQEKILESLGKQNYQTFTDLFYSKPKIDRDSLSKGLNELYKEQKLIKKQEDTNRYYLPETKNKKLLMARDHNIMKIDLESSMKELREHDTPFELGYTLLRSVTYYLSQLTIEQYSPGLKESERYECERLIKHCNKIIKQTFEILEEINIKQAMILKKALDVVTTNPQYERQIAGLANRAQKRQAERTAKKIHRYSQKNKT